MSWLLPPDIVEEVIRWWREQPNNHQWLQAGHVYRDFKEAQLRSINA